MARRASTRKAGISSLDDAENPSSLPRRTSLRLARSSSSTNTKQEYNYQNTDEGGSNNLETIGSLQGGRIVSIEVAIPLKKQSLSYASSTSPSAEDISRDETNEYSTPATSVAVTPAAESDINKSRKRVSASARARQLRSSTMSLGNTQRGQKRTSAAISTDFPPSENSDAALAQALQIQEYQEPFSKRQKVSAGKINYKLEIEDSEDDSALTELSDDDVDEEVLEQWQPKRNIRISRRLAGKTVIPNNEDSHFLDDGESEGGPEYDYDTDAESSGSASSSSEDEPLISQRSRNLNATNARTRTRTRAPASSRSSSRPVPIWMGPRAVRERKKLEKQHPIITTMWDDLRKSPPITPVAAEQPRGISRTLKSFQLEGLNWMMQQEKSQYKGGLLGDEMGMGKTIQAVSLLMSDYPAGKPSLVVVPPVALMQWQSEIKAYTNGQFKVLVYHNSNSKVKHLTKKDLLTYDVIMISYSGLESIHRKEWKGWNRNDGIVKEDSIIHSIDYHRLILDEAHSIKQRTTSVARACFALKANYKWCLSGTPVQNRIGEFFSLLRFLEVRPFACYFCKQCQCQQLHWSQDAEKRCTYCKHSGFSHVSVFNQEILNPITERNNAEARKDALAKLRLITDRIMLRRLKRDHTASMELPSKRVILHREFFGEIERDFSRSIMTNSARQFDTYVSRGVMLNNYANIFGLIMQMRQVSNHPDLILKKHTANGQNVLVCSICDEPAEEAIRSRCHHEFCRRCAKDYIQSFDADTIVDCPRCHIPLSIDFEQPDIEQEEDHVKKNSIINRIRMEDWTSSTKIEMLVYELYKLRSKKQTHKSIVFSQFTSMLQLVEWRLRRAGFNTVMLDGTMTPAQRQRSIDHFMNNVDVEVFLVSLKAGGVALNLTEASRVFIVDPWWNPAAEWQSADRCHRIGQRRPCVITRLCIEDSVESRIVLLQEKKANMINGTINKDQGEALEKLTPEDMQFLFHVRVQPSLSATFSTAVINEAIDEETITGYSPDYFHSTHAGQILNDRYQTITKLGWGFNSTVWLAEDTRRCKEEHESPRYVAIKIATSAYGGTAAKHELKLSQRVATANPSHPGADFIRTPINDFQINRVQGAHICLVYRPMRETLYDFRHRFRNQRLPPRILKLHVAILLQGLNYLHSECHIIHTDLKEDNILMDLENESALEDFVHEQKQTPLPRHVSDNGHITYLSQSDFGPLRDYFLLPEIADLDVAQSGEGLTRIHPAQPHIYRAPEVILGTGWSYSADFWNLGVLIWNMMENKDLFTNLKDGQGHYNAHAHIAQIIALLGPPPMILLKRERIFRKWTFAPEIQNPKGQSCRNAFQYFGGPFFEDNGEFLRKELIPQDLSIADSVTFYQGEEKQLFLDFVGRMLQWEPGKRSTAKDLLEDPFLRMGDEDD